MDELTATSRTALLDVLEELGVHRNSIILVGAHAIYMQVAATQSALAPFTRDGDLAIDPRSLVDDPRLEDALQRAGFTLSSQQAPGIWLRGQDEIDLMVPAKVGGGGKRAARIPPHDRYVARKTVGLEGALVDHDKMSLSALNPAQDSRKFQVRVAGPAALLVSKLFKLRDRLSHDNPERRKDKDAHDIFRLLIGTEPGDLQNRYIQLLADDISKGVATTALSHIQHLFAAGHTAPGSTMAGRAEEGVGNPETVSQQVSILAAEFLEQIKR